MQIKIQKNQIRFHPNQEVEPGVFKDVLSFGITSVDFESPTFGIQVQVDPDVTITATMISTAIENRVTDILAQRQLNLAAQDQMVALSGVTESNGYLFADIGD